MVTTMEIGLGWKTYEPDTGIVDLAVEAEDVGFDWVGVPETRLDPIPFLAAIATRTDKIKVASVVSVAFASNPMSVAMMARSMQAISGERFVLGLGSQVKASISKRYSSKWSEPAARMGEFVAAINHIWNHWETGDRLNFRGKFYRHTFSPPVYTPPPGLVRPEIGVACVGPLMTETVAGNADLCFTHLMASDEYLMASTVPAIDAGAAQRTDRQRAKLVRWIGVLTADSEGDLAAAVEEARFDLAVLIATPNYRTMLDTVGLGDLQERLSDLVLYREYDKMAELVTDEILHTFYAVGAPEDLPDQVAARVGGPVDRVFMAVNQTATPRALAPALTRLRQTI